MNKRWQIILATLLLLTAFQAKAVDYELPDVDGQMQSLDQYKGKWVVVNYWASWCSTCMKELPDLVSLHEGSKGKDIVVVGVNFESISNDRLKTFVAEKSIPYPVLSSEPIPVTPLGRVPALPTTYIIDPSGKVVAGEVGIVTRENLEAYITRRKAQTTTMEQMSNLDDAT